MELSAAAVAAAFSNSASDDDAVDTDSLLVMQRANIYNIDHKVTSAMRFVHCISGYAAVNQ